MIDKLHGAAQIPQSLTGSAPRNASGETPAFGAMLRQRMGRRDASRTQAAPQSASVEAIRRDALAQSAIAQAMRQSAITQAVPQSAIVPAAPTAPQSATPRTVNFSKHALARVEERGIEITPDLMGRLADSVEKAQEKGAKNILAFSDSQAFIVNIPYGRVITAMSGDEMRENVFTNIDGAVLL